jgi:hypothetical protein
MTLTVSPPVGSLSQALQPIAAFVTAKTPMGRSTRSVDAFTSNPKVIMPTAAAGLLETDGLGFVPPHDVKRDAASAATNTRCTRTPEIPQHAKTAVRRSTRGPIPVRSTPHYTKPPQRVDPERWGRVSMLRNNLHEGFSCAIRFNRASLREH